MQTFIDRHLIICRAALSACLALLLNASSAVAATITVNSAADPAGFNPAITIAQLGATVTLRDAVNAANNTAGDDTISFDAVLGGATIALDQSQAGQTALVVTSGISITGPGGGLTISAGNSKRHFLVENGGRLALAGVTLRDGRVAADGGAIYNGNGGTLTLINCTVSGNFAAGGTANRGGGIYNTGGTVTLIDTAVSGNSANDGITLGGGIYNEFGGTLTLINSTVANNSASGSANYGGGIYNTGGGTVTVTNSTVSGNSVRGGNENRGGGICTDGGAEVTLTNSTISGNSATGGSDNRGGGIFRIGGLIQARNTIVSGNSATTEPNVSGSLSGASENNIVGDETSVLLAPLGFNGGATQTHALLPGSSAINAGNSCVLMPGSCQTFTAPVAVPTDQRGVARVGQVDIGAFEAPISLVVTNTNNDGAGSLRAAIDTANSDPAYDGIIFNIPSSDAGCANDVCTITLTSGELAITANSALAIHQANAPRVAISGNNSSRVLYVNTGANLTLSGVTVTGGKVTGGSENRGGGIYNDQGTLTLTNAAVSGNSVSAGTENRGGGIFNDRGTLTVINSAVSGNSAAFANGNYGGGIFGLGGMVTLRNSTVSNNSVTGSFNYGSGIFNAGEGTLTLTNSTVSGNSTSGGAYNYGGGIFIESGTANLTNSTVSNNSVSGGSNANNVGGIYNFGTLNARNTIISGNSASNSPNLQGPLSTNENNIIGNEANVRLAPLGFYGGQTRTHALLSGSSAINAGAAPYAPSTDQRGAARVGQVDIGAFELSNTGNGGNFRVTLPNGTITEPYSFDLVPNNGNFTYSVSGGNLPNGIILSTNPATNGVVRLAGTPGNSGIFNFSITATNGPNSNVTDYTLTINPLHLAVDNTTDDAACTACTAAPNDCSLRGAIARANANPESTTITFEAALAGQTVTLSTAAGDADGWDSSSALAVTGNVAIEGPTTSPGVTLGIGSSAALRHFVVRSGASLTLENLTVTGGKPQLASFSRGGAISAFGDFIARNCTFTGNTSPGEGGAVQNWPGAANLVLENCTFSGNSGGSQGAAFSANGTQATLRYLTITNNTAPGSAVVLWWTQATMVNSIVAGNSNETVLTGSGGTFTAQSTNNLLGASSATGLTNGSNGNQLSVPVSQLLLGALGSNGGPTPTVAISAGSLAVDAGVALAGLATDQRGLGRPQGNAVEIGALELVPSVAAAIPIVFPLGGTYEGSVQISITSTSARATVRYTLDGSTPSVTNGFLYSAPFNLTQTATVKAIAYNGGWFPSAVASVGYTVLTPLSDWRALHGLAANGSQDLATPAGDGIANLLKYAFNMAPNAGDLPVPNITVLPANGTAGLPFITRDAQGRLFIEFVRRKAAASPDIVYIVETGDDLTNLQPLDLGGASVVSIDAVWERVTVIDPVITPKRFGRLRVQGPYLNDFNAGLGAATVRGAAVWSSQAVMLTDAINGQSGAVVFDGLTSTGLSGFSARFNLALGPTTTGIPADGASFAVGDLGNGAWGETGPGTAQSLAVGFDTYENGGAGSIGIHVWVNGNHLAADATDPYTNGALVPVEISYDAAAGLTVRFNGALIFSSRATPGFTFPAGGKFGIGARTGGANERAVVDNVEIVPR